MEDILTLVSTLIVIVRILQYLVPSDGRIKQLVQMAEAFITKESQSKRHELVQLVGENFSPIMAPASDYVAKTNSKYPLVYSTLELGKSWEEVVFKMLNV